MAVAVNDMKAVSLLTAFFLSAALLGRKQNAPRKLVPAAHFAFFWGQ